MLIVVRHGRTDANAAGLLLGRADPPLDSVGRGQASAVAAALAPLAPDTRIISSPLRRARETAALIARDGPIEIDERWIELDYGGLESKPLVDIPVDTWTRWRSDVSFAPEGGESIQSLGARVAAACAELLPSAEDSDIIVVTHVSPVKAALAWALGVGDEIAWRSFVSPGSITRIGSRQGAPVLRSFNEMPLHSQ